MSNLYYLYAFAGKGRSLVVYAWDEESLYKTLFSWTAQNGIHRLLNAKEHVFHNGAVDSSFEVELTKDGSATITPSTEENYKALSLLECLVIRSCAPKTRRLGPGAHRFFSFLHKVDLVVFDIPAQG